MTSSDFAQRCMRSNCARPMMGNDESLPRAVRLSVTKKDAGPRLKE